MSRGFSLGTLLNEKMIVKDDLQFFVFPEDEKLETKGIEYEMCIKAIRRKTESDNLTQNDAGSKELLSFCDLDHYGNVAGLRSVWQNCKSPYIGFSLIDEIPDYPLEDIEKSINNNASIILPSYKILDRCIKDTYRYKYYGYDLKVLRQYLNGSNSPMYHHFENKILNENKYIPPAIIMRKDVFRKFCVWLFPILEACSKNTSEKRSKMQNKSMQYLTYVLINLYVSYNYDKFKVIELNSVLRKIIFPAPKDQLNSGSLVEKVWELIKKGEIEEAEVLCEANPNDPNYDGLKTVFLNYARQKIHFSQTDLDTIEDFGRVMESPEKLMVKKSEKKVLFIFWNAINNIDYDQALRSLGLKVDTMDVGDIYSTREDATLDRLLEFFDNHSYDVVFTINFFESISEACYVHNIPYISWAYDSPIAIKDEYRAKRSTTSIFLFDSDEVANYRKRGFDNVYYVPLAVNTEKYDSIICSDEDFEKYAAQISFVGRLYDNRLNEYLNYMSDYKKGLFNAIIDYNTGLYDSYGVEDAMASIGFDDNEDKTLLNAVLRGEKDDKFSPIYSKEEVFGRIGLLTQKTITNRERLILISMLSNHWDFKLYSTSTHEVFKTTKECGQVNYDTEMPKVFKCSDINLNITFKTIKTGIPLRCLDVMGCNAFLLTSYQRDLDEDFKDGENIAIFHSFDEAYDKCEYYLAHDSERRKIAQKGYETVRDKYSYKEQFKKIFKLANLSHLVENE